MNYGTSPRHGSFRMSGGEPLLDPDSRAKARAAGLLDEQPEARAGSSAASAVFNVLNVYVGLGLLSKPYAIAQGGSGSVALLAVLCTLANVTGKLIVRGFAKLSKTEQNYASLGEKAFGPAGKWLVLSFVSAELFGALLVLLIFVWKNFLILAPWVLPDSIITQATVAIIGTAAATPTIWMLDFGALAGIGLIGVIASIMIVVVVVGMAVWYFAVLPQAGTLPPVDLPVLGDASQVSMAAGIFVLSLGGHAALPGVYASMADKRKFDRVLDVSMLAMFGIYTSVGVGGYAAYGWLRGEKIDVLISTNMAADGGVPALLMTVAVLAKSFCAISPITAVLADLPELLLLPAVAAGAARERQQRALRTGLLWVAAFVAYVVADELAVVEAVTGAMCSMMVSVVLPCACWAALYREEVPASHAVAAAALAAVASVAGAAFTTFDLLRL